MMKKIFVTFALLLSLGMSLQGVAAQELAPSDAGVSLEDYEGLQSAYSRSYGPDIEALMASPSAEGIDIAAMMKGVQIMAITFDSDDNAKKFMEDGKEELENSLNDESMDFEVTVEDSDLGDDGYTITMDMTADVGIVMEMAMFRDDNVVFNVIVTDGDLETAKDTSEKASEYILDTDSESDEVTFNADGTSTGGVFDRMPKVDHESVAGMTIQADTDLLNLETTPAQ